MHRAGIAFERIGRAVLPRRDDRRKSERRPEDPGADLQRSSSGGLEIPFVLGLEFERFRLDPEVVCHDTLPSLLRCSGGIPPTHARLI